MVFQLFHWTAKMSQSTPAFHPFNYVFSYADTDIKNPWSVPWSVWPCSSIKIKPAQLRGWQYMAAKEHGNREMAELFELALPPRRTFSVMDSNETDGNWWGFFFLQLNQFQLEFIAHSISVSITEKNTLQKVA